MLGLAEFCVVVQGDLAVQGEDGALGGQNEGVNLNQGCVFLGVDFAQLDENGNNLLLQFCGETCCLSNFLSLSLVQADQRVNLDLCQCLGALSSELLNFHTAFYRAHCQVGAVCTVQQEGEVVFFGDVCAVSDQHAVNGVALDVHAENCLSVLVSFFGGLCELNAASLTAAAGLNLSLNDGKTANFLSCCLCFFRGGRNNALEHGYTVLCEELARLVFEKVHRCPSSSKWCRVLVHSAWSH
ncbi:Uncharacterised protein [Mycobacterium tuberculosis]|nr:Uncharacterised protein [Mycobacterium tuberculosis]